MNTEISMKPIRTINPKPLRRGKTIAVISPAGPAEESRLQAGVRELRRRGYKVKTGKHAAGRLAYFSGSTEERLADLVRVFSDPSVDAILCSRGGYGSARLLNSIPYDLITQNPKLFVGFSDLTALNWAFYRHAGLITFTGPLVCEMGENMPESTFRSFQKMTGARQAPEFLWNGPLEAVRPGKALGRFFPGCLAIIETLLGTPHLPDLKGAILLIEEIGERPYQVDRMLTHLKNAGIFDHIAALLIGRMVDCWPKRNKSHHLSLEEILLDLTSSHPIPIYTGLPYGHHPDRLTLPVGVRVEISARRGLRLIEDPLSRKAKA